MLPPTLAPLVALSRNLWWTWDAEATALLREADPFLWERLRHNPVAVLARISPDRVADLAADAGYVARVRQVEERFEAYLTERDTWCARTRPDLRCVAYFSMEFGLHESLRTYSGGLGVLAGDHIKSASDIGVPLVGISLLYREGYFRQLLDDGRQSASYPAASLPDTPFAPCLDSDGKPYEVVVPIGEEEAVVRAWQVAVGRCRLLLLDVDHEANAPSIRGLNHRLYGGDQHTRIGQEVLLGIGGVQMLHAMGYAPDVYHLNEGHCAFAPVALIRERTDSGATLPEALADVRDRCVFTTHTPVPAGHDRFPWTLVNEALGPWRVEAEWPRGSIMDLGRERPGHWDQELVMTVLALRTSRLANGVSALHGEVSREMWQHLWSGATTPDEVPIGHVTNGVHPLHWMSREAQQVYDAHLPGWRESLWDGPFWDGVEAIPDEVLWQLRRTLRSRLVDEVRRKTGQTLDPDALTIGFARRFATYKRGDLLFSDPDRLEALLEGPEPVQVIFSGKAHPRDLPGQEVLARVVSFAWSSRFRHRIAFLEDYDMGLGALLTQGADVWLNTPRRPQEASGTSGQKVPLNGGVNLSVLDGWWPEAYDGTNGWPVGEATLGVPPEVLDPADADALYRTLETQVIPLWADRDDDGIPREWLRRVRRSMRTCIPVFNSHRMVADYVEQVYAPSR